MTSETYCPDCAATSTEIVTDPVESGWATTGSSYSYVTLLTITIATDYGFVNPEFVIDTALEYSQMSSMDKEISAMYHTKLSSTLITSVLPASSRSSAEASLSTSLQVSSPSSILTSSLQPVLQEPTPTPAPTGEPPAPEQLPITVTRGECNSSGCEGVDRDLALKEVKKFCSTEVTINSKTVSVSTDVVILPTSISKPVQPRLADLHLAIELDHKDDRCTAVEYVNLPIIQKPSMDPIDYEPRVVGPNQLCMDMMQAALDHCDTDTTMAKKGGKQIANCISWSVLAIDVGDKCSV
ncbi:hypothetical protein BKA64DRAFT_659526, partial [Cadophora sp. MPI-SDFR-AT-0126]